MTFELDHVGIAVAHLDETVAWLRTVLGFAIDAVDEVASQAVRAHFVPAGQGRVTLELLEATTPESVVAKYVARRGPGLHHLAFRVDDVAAALARLKQQGVRLIDEVPRRGAEGALVAFIHPSATGGVLVELKQPAH